MKKRYLAMLMAVVMCFGLFITGAMAADEGTETPVETTEVTTEVPAEVPTEVATEVTEVPAESAAPSEQPTESAAPSETSAASDVPQAVMLGNDGEGEGAKLTQQVEVTAGEEKTVTYDMPLNTPGKFAWTDNNNKPADGDVVVTVEEGKPLSITVKSTCRAGTYPFSMPTTAVAYTGTLVVKSATSPSASPVTLSFPIEQKVEVQTTGAEPGENTFTYELQMEFGDDADASLAFTPNEVDGVTWSSLTLKNTETDSGYTVKKYTLSVTTNGEGTGSGKPSITTKDEVILYLFETNKATKDWTFGYRWYEVDVASTEYAEEKGWGTPIESSGGLSLYIDGREPLTGDAVPTIQNPTVGYHYDTADGKYTSGATLKYYYGNDGMWYTLSGPTSATSASFTNKYTGPVWEYEGFTVNAWTANFIGWNDEKKEYISKNQTDLKGAVFAVYGEYDEETGVCSDKLVELTTDKHGNATVTPKDFGSNKLPAIRDSATYYLKQISSPADPVYGERPVPSTVWTIDALTTWSESDNKVTVTLTTESKEAGVYYAKSKTLEVYNDQYISMNFDIQKTVTVKNKGAEPGTNVFDFLIAFVSMDGGDVKVEFTPEGGTPTELKVTEEVDGQEFYKVSLTVDGVGTAKGTVTVSGWENALVAFPEVYETTADKDNWEHTKPMYVFFPVLLGDDEQGYAYVIYDGEELKPSIMPQVAAPEGGLATMPGSYCDDAFTVYRGYDGLFYSGESEYEGTANFASVYTAALAATATPAPTAKPAQAPKTGDEANLVLWLALATVSVFGVALVGRKKVK